MTERLNKTHAIRELIDHRLKSLAAVELRESPIDAHLDEDTIAAYIEGRLNDAECKPVLAHLAACGGCRRSSAKFVQLENQIDAQPINEISPDAGPSRLEALLAKIGSVAPTNEDVVFAYQNPSESESDSKEDASEGSDGSS